MEYLSMAIQNAIAIITFAILAWVFHKWWIIFFALLFIVTIKEDNEDKEV